MIDDGLDFGTLNAADDQTIVERLTAVHGIGPWTADIYILFALARKDAFASGDLALQLAVQHHFKLDRRPTAEELERIAERWRPSRAIAARLLWADYAFARRALLASRQKAARHEFAQAVKINEKSRRRDRSERTLHRTDTRG